MIGTTMEKNDDFHIFQTEGANFLIYKFLVSSKCLSIGVPEDI